MERLIINVWQEAAASISEMKYPLDDEGQGLFNFYYYYDIYSCIRTKIFPRHHHHYAIYALFAFIFLFLLS